MVELGVKIVKDSMGGDAAGAFWFLIAKNPADESRSTSEEFYLPERKNLHLLPNHQVTKVILEKEHGKVRATGAEYVSGSNRARHRVRARKDVILSAGALFTPQILQLSGIGDKRLLKKVGIEAVVDLPGVGANHQDHLMYLLFQTGRLFDGLVTPLILKSYSEQFNKSWKLQ